MATNRSLLQYLPRYMQGFQELQQIMGAEQPEIDRLWTAADKALADQFIPDATEYGVSRWEIMLGLSHKATDTLEERKFRILAQLNQELPYTVKGLEQMLTNLCGVGGFSVVLTAAQYQIEVKLALSNGSNYREVEQLLNRVVPANLKRVITIMYNPNAGLAKFTHAQLSAYTHNQLRSEVFENGK